MKAPKIPKIFLQDKDLTDVIKRALKEHEEEKKPKPTDLSKLDYKAVEFEYKDGTREVLKADLLKYRNKNYVLSGFNEYDLPHILQIDNKGDYKNPILIIDEKNPKKIVKMIDSTDIRAIRTNYLEV